jgi:hypothetical protein
MLVPVAGSKETMVISGGTPCLAHLGRLHKLQAKQKQMTSTAGVDMLLRAVEECWERLCCLAQRAGAGVMLARLQRDAAQFDSSLAVSSTTEAQGRLGLLEVMLVQTQAADQIERSLSTVDFALAAIMDVYLRLCPGSTASAYPVLVAHYTQFCERASVQVKSVLCEFGRAGSEATGSRLASVEAHVRSQQLQLFKDGLSTPMCELWKCPPERWAGHLAGRMQPDALALLCELPLFYPANASALFPLDQLEVDLQRNLELLEGSCEGTSAAKGGSESESESQTESEVEFESTFYELKLEAQKQKAVQRQDFDEAARLRDAISALREMRVAQQPPPTASLLISHDWNTKLQELKRLLCNVFGNLISASE